MKNKKGGVGIDKYYGYEIITNPVSIEFTHVLNKIASKYIFVKIYYYYGNATIMKQRARSDWYQSFETNENLRGAYFMCFIKDNKLLFQGIHKNPDKTWRLEKCNMTVCSPVENPELNLAFATWKKVIFVEKDKNIFKEAINNLPEQSGETNQEQSGETNQEQSGETNEQQNEEQLGGKSLSRKPLDKCTVAELKEKAKKRGIKVTGLKKDEILAKLRKK